MVELKFMRLNYLGCIASLLLLVFIAGCGGSNGKIVSEGIIEFEASAVDPNNPMADLAPSKMLIKFKDHKSVVEMSAGMGLLTMSFITDYNNKTVTQLVKLLNKKYVSVANGEAIQTDADNNKLKIQKTNDTKIIAGFRCKKAVVTSEDKSRPPFDIYYTDEIEIDQPNWSNEYSEIEGVLMEYQLKRYNLELRFTARKVAKASIDDSDFETPPDYKTISQKELEDLFVGMQ